MMHLNLWKTMRLIGLTGWSIYKLDLLQLSKHVLVLEILMRNNPWRLLSDDWSATTVLTTFLHRLSDQHALFNGHEVLLLKLQFSAARISSRNRMIGYLLCSICLSFFLKKNCMAHSCYMTGLFEKNVCYCRHYRLFLEFLFFTKLSLAECLACQLYKD